jgi:hypothetical protein
LSPIRATALLSIPPGAVVRDNHLPLVVADPDWRSPEQVRRLGTKEEASAAAHPPGSDATLPRQLVAADCQRESESCRLVGMTPLAPLQLHPDRLLPPDPSDLVTEHRLDEDEAEETLVDLVTTRPGELFKL